MDYILLAVSIFSLIGITLLFVREKKAYRTTIENSNPDGPVISDKILDFVESQLRKVFSVMKKQDGFIGSLKNKHRSLVRTVQGKVSRPSRGTASVFLRDLATEKREIE